MVEVIRNTELGELDRGFMRLAIAVAQESTEPLKCGSVFVKEGRVLAAEHNSQRLDSDQSRHAEIKAMGKAGAVLGGKELRDVTVYSTCEPCTMCISAMVFAEVKRVVYGVSKYDVWPQRIDVGTLEFLGRAETDIEVVANFMERECAEALYPKR